MKTFTLNELGLGEKAVVCDISEKSPLRRRLRDIGLANGTEIECVTVSPLGDPAAYFIRGALIAIRREDCSFITVCGE